MSSIDMSLLAIDIRKWDLETQKITMMSYYLLSGEEKSIIFEISILQPPEMVEEFLGKLKYEVGELVNAGKQQEAIEINFDNETFLRQKTYNYFKRITSELNSPRRKKGQTKMIRTVHMDVYNENQDISFLPKNIQFYVVLNWARRYYSRDKFKEAVEPLRQLIKIDPNQGIAYKWLARSLKKLRKYEEATKLYEKRTEIDPSAEAWLDLAKSYRKGKMFNESEKIYLTLLKQDSGNKEARIGLAQIYYANKNNKYMEVLEELSKEDLPWLNEWLTEEFNFRIYVNEKTLLTPAQTARFMGYPEIMELTQRAFKNEFPSHFHASRAKLTFFREELENWASVMNKFNSLGRQVVLYPEKIHQTNESDQSAKGTGKAKVAGGDGKAPKSNFEMIMEQIKARKAAREAGQQTAATAKKPSPPPQHKKSNRNSRKSMPVNEDQLDLLSQLDDNTSSKPPKRNPKPGRKKGPGKTTKNGSRKTAASNKPKPPKTKTPVEEKS